jgi:hypothetical protein
VIGVTGTRAEHHQFAALSSSVPAFQRNWSAASAAAVARIDDVSNETWFVHEFSSHQLAEMVSPQRT